MAPEHGYRPLTASEVGHRTAWSGHLFAGKIPPAGGKFYVGQTIGLLAQQGRPHGFRASNRGNRSLSSRAASVYFLNGPSTEASVPVSAYE